MLERKFLKLLREKGPYDLTRRLFRKAFQFILHQTDCVLIQFKSPTYDLNIPDGYGVEVREITLEEACRLPKNIRIPPTVLQERWTQGARMFGALWRGKITYYAWIYSDGVFRDKTDGFQINLKSDEGYCFDYKSISTPRPKIFRSFRLLKALIWIMVKTEEKKRDRKMTFYALIEQDNLISLEFHRRILQGQVVATVRLYRFLGRKGFTLKPARS